VSGQFDLFAPEHIRYEVANALTMATRRTPPRLTVERAEAAISEFLALPLTTFGDNDLLVAGFAIAAGYGCSFYDAVYLAVAQRTRRVLVTADQRFYDRIRRSGLAAWIGDFRLP